MKHFILTAAALLSASASLGATEVLTSPDGRLQLSFDRTADERQPTKWITTTSR